LNATASPKIDYSIVIPVYFNEGSLIGLVDSVRREIVERSPDRRGELIFVDDGSGDGSLDELLQLQREQPDLITVIKLTRNFGQVNAIAAGFGHARGQHVAVISADGQDPPALIHEMLRAAWDDGYEIVVCTRGERDESLYRAVTSRLFYKLMRRLSFSNLPPGGFDFFLLGRRVVDVLLRNQEAHAFLQGQILWTGFRPKFIEYRREKRTAGTSRWTFGRKLTYLLDGVMGYSFVPLRLISASGVIVALLGFLYALLIIVVRLAYGNPVQGWAPLMVVVLVMGGLQMLMLGVLGEYVWRTLAATRGRDAYVIERVYEGADASAGPGAGQV
jgi:glycosyltransferase involved in cell wall biosynthesis